MLNSIKSPTHVVKNHKTWTVHIGLIGASL